MTLKTVVLLFLCLFITPTLCIGQSKSFYFNRLSTSDGLSNPTIKQIIQDSNGFLWFASEEGANRFDGYKFTTFRSIAGDTASLSNNRIESIAEDKFGNIWIGTANGLNKYNPKTNTFEHFYADMNSTNSVSSNYINNIFPDEHGIWISTTGGGLDYYNFAKKQFTNYSYNVYNKNSICSNDIWSAFRDSKGRMWFLSLGNGLSLFNEETGTFKSYKFDLDNGSINITRCMFEWSEDEFFVGTDLGLVRFFPNKTANNFSLYEHDPNNKNSISGGQVRCIYRDKVGRVWVTNQNGLDIYNVDSDDFKHVKTDKNDRFSISANEVWGMTEDNQGSLWMGTYKGGVNQLVQSHQYFKSWKFAGDKYIDANYSSVISILNNPDSTIWIGIDHGGLLRLDKQNNIIDHYVNDPKNKKSISSNTPLALMRDKENRLWAGLYAGAINWLDEKTNSFNVKIEEGNFPTTWHVWDMIEDTKKRIWLAFLGTGVKYYEADKNEFTSFASVVKDTTTLSSNDSWVLYEDSRKNIWVGTTTGLNLFNEKDNSYTYFPYITDKGITLNNYQVFSIFEDSHHRLWVGTSGNGLNLLNRSSKKFTPYANNSADGSNVVYQIQEDAHANLWMSTNRGISKLTLSADGEELKVQNFGTETGLRNEQFNVGASDKAPSGELFFGSNDGFVRFFPDSITPNNIPPKTVITSFKLFNQEVSIDPTGKLESPLKTHIAYANEIVLTHDQSVFSFEFAALSYVAPNRNQYLYKLDGFDKDWVQADKRREVSYTNLNAGTYTLRIKASNNDGVWAEKETTLRIKILPPWWESWTFRISVLLFVVTIGFTGYKLRLRQIKIEKRILEHEVRVRTRNLEEANVILKEKQEEISIQNIALMEQNEVIEESHRHISDSIKCAQRIQGAVLPPPYILGGVFNDYFLFFKPRDVVSGDFYWTRKIDNYMLIIAADCTGHGVPGAFVSMLGISFLNEITQNESIWSSVNTAAELLAVLRTKVKTALHENTEDFESKDGMDLALCVVNLDSLELQFAGANNSICIIRDSKLPTINTNKHRTEVKNGFRIEQIKGDPMPIGAFSQEMPFTNHIIQLHKHDKLYLFTDGYVDQFNLKGDQKFLVKHFRKLLLEIHTNKMEDQLKTLRETFDNWKGYRKQIDDVLVLGIHI